MARGFSIVEALIALAILSIGMLGIAALLARDHVDAKGGLAAAYGLALYNVLAGALILWSSAVIGLGGAMLWGAGLFHALVGLLFVYALVTAGRR